MLIDTIAKFVAIIPTADGTDFSPLSPYIAKAEIQIKNELLGADCFSHISALPDSSELLITLKHLIANKGYVAAIPYVDLTQTVNGFAVVSNGNYAPASRERVDKLIARCNDSIDEFTDLLIDLIQQTDAARAEWAKFAKHTSLTNCFFYTATDFARYADTGVKRADFLKQKSKLLLLQRTDLAERLSADYVNELIEAIRSNSLTDRNESVVDNVKIALCAWLSNNEEEANDVLDRVVTDIEADIDNYSAYKNSREYALKTVPRYVNTTGAYFMP